MNTDEPLVQLESEPSPTLQFHENHHNINTLIISHTRNEKEQKASCSSDKEDNDCASLTGAEDRQSIISISSSSTTEEACLIPEVYFDNVNLESSASCESQPLLGGRDPIEIPSNYFPGTEKKPKKNIYLPSSVLSKFNLPMIQSIGTYSVFY